jgi:hypothetical protein
MSLDLDKRVTSTIEVVRPNYLDMFPGGWYELGLDNDTEERVVRLHLLQHFISMMMEDICESGENRVIQHVRTEALADDLFELYRPFIEAGCDIFSHAEFYDRKTLDKYKSRPIVNGYMNAGPNDKQAGLPDGWWYEFPGQAQKMFDFGFVVIDEDECVRIGIYEHDTNEQPIDMIYITQRGDYRELYKKHLNHASEISTVCDWIYEQSHI